MARPRRALFAIAVTALALSGCTSRGPETDDTPPAAPDPAADANATAAAAAPLYDDLLGFASATGGSAGSAGLDVPAGATRLNVTVEALGECPGGYGNAAAIEVAGPDGNATSIPLSFAGTGAFVDGNDPYACSPAATVAGEPEAFGPTTLVVEVGETGPWTVAAVGEFTGSARVTVVAS